MKILLKNAMIITMNENREVYREGDLLIQDDKIAKLGYHIAHQDGVAYIEEAETVLLCRKLSATRITADQFIDPEIEKKWYADGDMHTMYIGEMIGVLKKQ